MSNFEFLRDQWPEMAVLGSLAEKYLYQDAPRLRKKYSSKVRKPIASGHRKNSKHWKMKRETFQSLETSGTLVLPSVQPFPTIGKAT